LLVKKMDDGLPRVVAFMVSFDIVFLFTKILVLEALVLIPKLVDPKILNLIKVCLTSTLFSFKNKNMNNLKAQQWDHLYPP